MVKKFSSKKSNKSSIAMYAFANGNGVEVRVINYGGIITSLRVPDVFGRLEDIVLGFDAPEEYLQNRPYFGAIIGRYANRIAQGKFTLGGIEYNLARNDGLNSLHGGNRGFDKVLWQAEPVRGDHGQGIILTYTSKDGLTYTSKDGEEGYPGNLNVQVIYTLSHANELILDYEAATDRDTPVNLTHHGYFNLMGEGRGDVLRHQLMLNAAHFTPINQDRVATGEIWPVENTPMDFREPTAIGARISQECDELRIAGGYDHNFVLSKNNGKKASELPLAARVHEPVSGRTMEVYTTEPGIQFYSGKFLDGTITGKHGQVYQKHHGFCLEAQHFPDSPNHPNFPSTILRPGETYRSRTVYKLLWDREGRQG